MTQSELTRRRKRYLWLSAGPCLAGAALIGATASVMAYWEESHRQWPPGLWLASNVLAWGVILASIVIVALLEHRIAARCGFRCPQCEKVLVGKTGRVLTSGKCPRCGRRILDDVP